MNTDSVHPAVVRVQLFASYAERLGAEHLEIPAGEVRTAGDVLAWIRAMPKGGAVGSATLVAVNLRHASPETAVGPGDEVAIMPPLAGG